MRNERRKIYISTAIAIMFLIAFLLGLPWVIWSLSKVHEKNNVILPNRGVWYCEELEMTLDFAHDTGHVMYQGEYTQCEIGQERGDINSFFVEIQKNRIDKVVFYGHCSEACADKVCIIDDETEVLYWFLKIEE